MICATMEASALPGREAAIASGSNTLNARPNYNSCDPCWRWPNDWRENHAYTLGVQAYVLRFPYLYLPSPRWDRVNRPKSAHELPL
jgi:hypothetical protein